MSNSTASTDIVRLVRTRLEVLEPVADSSLTFLKSGEGRREYSVTESGWTSKKKTNEREGQIKGGRDSVGKEQKVNYTE